MKKARPAELNQKIKRLKESRDDLKCHNLEKSLRNKALRDRTVEITENRDQWKVIPVGQVWVGSSEILESLFGKLKSLEQDQSKGGFTSLVLGAAACVGKVDADTVSAAMRQVSTGDVDAWTKEQMGPTLISKRRKSLGSWRKKKRTKNVVHEKAGISLMDVARF